ncbi:hypothetical protein ARALYDRAFT_903448 [Arabidopsis lyrata subsp. lyrata]|uniref:Uncharacterized protein n=1 Tax=Arabidopsis lyrata subsp. lyrata TaxID=81972 RepID=D7LH59_ARALL|nr:hypothetical protein ARALYDRAFT_903448 [Arabidopsis lyrata subsp. lyrata]
MQKSLNRPCSGWNFTICQTVQGRISQNRVREILESAGMSQESLPSNVVSSAQVLANVANLLNIRDTELSRYTACGANI